MQRDFNLWFPRIRRGANRVDGFIELAMEECGFRRRSDAVAVHKDLVRPCSAYKEQIDRAGSRWQDDALAEPSIVPGEQSRRKVFMWP